MSLRRATGRAAFAGDVALPGLLQLALRRSPHAHARVVSVDTTTAASLPGVAAILTPENAPNLLASELRFFGERLAVAAAEELESARRAVDAIEIDLVTLPAVLDAAAAAADASSVAARLSLATGDLDAAFAEAEDVVEGEWQLPFAPALALEPPQAVTWLDEDRRLVVRTSADSPYYVRAALAERLRLPAARIRVVRPLVAGGSDGAAGLAAEDLCAAVTLRTGRPARLVLSGDDQLVSAPGRPAQRVRVRISSRAGRFTALELQLLIDVGASGERAAEMLRASARHALSLYAAPALRVEAVAVCTHKAPSGLPRGCERGAAFVVECAVDEAARRAGADPMAFRLSRLRGGGDPGAALLRELGEPEALDDRAPLASVLAALPRADPAGVRDLGPERRLATGFGLARRSPDAAAARGPAASLHLLDDGSFTLTTSASSSGGSNEGVYAAAAAAILTVPRAQVVCAAADTDSPEFEAGEPASSSFDATVAVIEAARRARERIREAGARLLEVAIGDTTIDSGQVKDGRGHQLSFAEIGLAALREGHPLVVTAAPPPSSVHASLAAARADIEVDLETGVVRITRLAVALASQPRPDGGAWEGAVEGALASTIEEGLACAQRFDPDGRPLVRTLRDWPLLTASDVPPLAVSFAPREGARSRVGEISPSEAAGGAALAAIANAVTRATGAPIRQLPLTPAVVLDSL